MDRRCGATQRHLPSGKGHTLALKIDNKQGEAMATIRPYFDVQVEDV